MLIFLSVSCSKKFEAVHNVVMAEAEQDIKSYHISKVET